MLGTIFVTLNRDLTTIELAALAPLARDDHSKGQHTISTWNGTD